MSSVTSVGGTASRVVIIHGVTKPCMDEIDETVSPSFTFVSVDGDFQTTLTHTINEEDTEWVLIMKAGEILTIRSASKIRNLANNTKEFAFYVTCQKSPPLIKEHADQDSFEWLGSLGMYRSHDVLSLSGLAFSEVRLFKKTIFKQLRIHDDYSILPIFNRKLSSISLSPIRLAQKINSSAPGDRLTEKQKQLQDYERYLNEPLENVTQYDGFKFLAPNSFSYAIMDETDYPGIMAGLENGWGHVDILKYMLFNLAKNGDYHQVIEFSNAITLKQGDLLDIWRIRGSAFFYLFDLENAEASFQKALTLNENDQTILFNLAKVYLIKNEYGKAKRILLDLKNEGLPLPEIDFILSAINEKQDRVAKLSLLMLCKDEADYIARALDSIKDVVDEIIVVDTGSQDNTVAIARDFGATVITHPWDNHFSEARNAGLGHVTGDYVLWMDADEFIYREDQISLLVLKSILPLKNGKGINIRVESFKEEPRSPSPLPPDKVNIRTSIFPNVNGISFSGRIFESVDVSMKKLGINVFNAENIRFLHITDNVDYRNQRNMQVLEKCSINQLIPEQVFMGISYWLEAEKQDKAVEWLTWAISRVQKNPKYDGIIAIFFSAFMQKGYLDIHCELFKTILRTFPHTYPIASMCANMLYHAGSYREAIDVFEKLFSGKTGLSEFAADDPKKLNDLVLYAATSLEFNQFASCDSVIKQLSKAENMYDAVQALRFYAEIKKRDLEKGIAVLDAWIRHRKLQISATLNSVADLTEIILRMVEIMTAYKQLNTSTILSRACQHLIQTFALKE